MTHFIRAIFFAALLAIAARAADADVAVAIVYDTSGSMAEPVNDASGKPSPKYVIGNRALEAIVGKLEKFTAHGGKKLQAGLFVFAGQEGKAAVPMGEFDAGKFRAWIKGFKAPNGGTPLGKATDAAARALLTVKAGARHVLVITDGMNTLGPAPEKLMPALNADAGKAGAFVSFHFVAFDVNAAVFSGVKREGATLVSAADEKQLNEKLTFLLEDKILLEKE